MLIFIFILMINLVYRYLISSFLFLKQGVILCVSHWFIENCGFRYWTLRSFSWELLLRQSSLHCSSQMVLQLFIQRRLSTTFINRTVRINHRKHLLLFLISRTLMSRDLKLNIFLWSGFPLHKLTLRVGLRFLMKCTTRMLKFIINIRYFWILFYTRRFFLGWRYGFVNTQINTPIIWISNN